MADFTEDLKTAAMDRINGQVTGTFILFLFFVNWQIPVLLFAENGNAEHKIQTIAALFPNFLVWARQCIMWPVILTAGYVLFVPILRHLNSIYQQNFVTSFALRKAKDEREVIEMATMGTKLGLEILNAKDNLNSAINTVDSLAMLMKGFRQTAKSIDEPVQLELDKQIEEARTKLIKLRDHLQPISEKANPQLSQYIPRPTKR